MQLLSTEVKVQIQKRDVTIRPWLYTVKSKTGGVVSVYFLDTDLEGNNPEDRAITSFLYGGDERYHLKQEIVLGMGGVKMLDALGLEIRKYHMNEAILVSSLSSCCKRMGWTLRKLEDCVFTTHTPSMQDMTNSPIIWFEKCWETPYPSMS